MRNHLIHTADCRCPACRPVGPGVSAPIGKVQAVLIFLIAFVALPILLGGIHSLFGN